MANKTKRIELRLSPIDYQTLLSLQNKYKHLSRTQIIELALMELAKSTKTYVTISYMDTFDTTLKRIKENEQRQEQHKQEIERLKNNEEITESDEELLNFDDILPPKQD